MKLVDKKIRIKPKEEKKELTGDIKIKVKHLQKLLHDADAPGTKHQWADGKWHQKQEDGTWLECSAPEEEEQKEEKETWRVPRSLGARAVEFRVKVPHELRKKGDNKKYILKEGSMVTNIELITRGHGIKNVKKLIKKYPKQNGKPTEATEWTKKKGFARVMGEDGEEKAAEIHWYECQGLGKKEFKVKKWKEEK